MKYMEKMARRFEFLQHSVGGKYSPLSQGARTETLQGRSLVFVQKNGRTQDARGQLKGPGWASISHRQTQVTPGEGALELLPHAHFKHTTERARGERVVGILVPRKRRILVE